MRFGESAGEKAVRRQRPNGRAARRALLSHRARRAANAVERSRTSFTAWLAPHATYTFHTSSIGRRSRRSLASIPITSLATQPLRRASLPRAGSRRPSPVESMEESIVWFKEIVMTRKYIDCREFPSEMNCTVAMSADSDSELLEAAVQHAVSVHKHADSPELRAQLKTLFHEGTPPAEAPRA
ncbi:putative small metal-binding protein [Paraburkholderia sp. JPY465]